MKNCVTIKFFTSKLSGLKIDPTSTEITNVICPALKDQLANLKIALR